MTRDDLKCFAALDIDHEAIGLMEPGGEIVPYFCTPVGVEFVGRLGVDGIHFVLLPGDEHIYCVDPAMGEIGTYVLPVAEDLREFLSYILSCRSAVAIAQIWWLSKARYDALVIEDIENEARGELPEYYAAVRHALDTISKTFDLTAKEPYESVRAMQAAFDPGILKFSDEYYDVLGIDRA